MEEKNGIEYTDLNFLLIIDITEQDKSIILSSMQDETKWNQHIIPEIKKYLSLIEKLYLLVNQYIEQLDVSIDEYEKFRSKQQEIFQRYVNFNNLVTTDNQPTETKILVLQNLDELSTMKSKSLELLVELKETIFRETLTQISTIREITQLACGNLSIISHELCNQANIWLNYVMDINLEPEDFKEISEPITDLYEKIRGAYISNYIGIGYLKRN